MLQKLFLPLLLVLVASVYFFTANGRAIFDDGDALYAHVAQNMMRSGDWVTPYADGVRFLDKPPMMYWLMAMSYRALGVSEFAARLPSVLAILGTCVLLYLMAKKAGNRSSGFIAGVTAAFCVGTFLFTRLVFPDMLFVFFLTLSLWAFLEWHSDEKNPLLPALLFYASLAGAVLTKSLIGLVFPLAIVFLFLAWIRGLSRLRYFHLWKGALLFLALTLPWHLLAARRNPGFLWYFFVNEQFLRFIGKRQPADYQSIPLPLFWALILVWLFPWSAFFPAIRHILSGFSSRKEMARPAVRLCAMWALVVLVFFSFSSRIEHYAMPIFPPMALLIGIALSPENLFNPSADSSRQRSVARSFSFLGILGGILAALMIVAMFAHIRINGISLSLAAAGRLHAYRYYFAPLFDMPAEILNKLEFPFWGTCMTLAGGRSEEHTSELQSP
jgi:4-amino-4-deoxy-L-arabinose transferase-like glycosyltransferase